MAKRPPNRNLCTFEGCARPRRARGLCGAHYEQLRAGKLGWRPLSEMERFRAKYRIDDGGCWLWIAGFHGTGYGSFKLGSVMHSHRASWILHHGPIPAGMHVCHHCDVRACVNPDHLFLGSHTDNMQDMSAKGRRAEGTRHPNSNLSEVDIIFIRANAHMKQRELARIVGCAQGSISRIINGLRYK